MSDAFAGVDDFEFWLIDMDDALERFLGAMPGKMAQQLDYSSKSLEALEAWLLEEFKSTEAALPPSGASRVDGAARYLGETYRQCLGGAWELDEDEESAFHGLPVFRVKGTGEVLCPMTLVTASLDRRTGSFLSGVFGHYARGLS